MLQIVERNKNKEPVYQETLAKMLATKKPLAIIYPPKPKKIINHCSEFHRTRDAIV